MHLIPRTDAPWVAIALLGVSTALATYLSLKFKVLLLSGNYATITLFYVWGVLAGRGNGRTGVHAYKTPLYPLIPILGAVIVIGEIVVLALDPDVGRWSLLICGGIYVAAFACYWVFLRSRPGEWVMTGPEDIDAATGAGKSAQGAPPTASAAAQAKRVVCYRRSIAQTASL